MLVQLLMLCRFLRFADAQSNVPAPSPALPLCANTDGSVANDGPCRCEANVKVPTFGVSSCEVLKLNLVALQSVPRLKLLLKDLILYCNFYPLLRQKFSVVPST